MLTDPSLDVNVRNEDFKAPIHIAAEKGALRILELLAGAPNVVFDLEDANRDTPLHISAAYGHQACVLFITTQSSCNPNKRNRFNNTALDLAATPEITQVTRYNIVDSSASHHHR
jgi:ankyrin repeat protein